jgi:hypothetical protein
VKPPDALRLHVAGDLQPVKPLAAPWRRTLWLAPVAIALLTGFAAALGLRADAPLLGPALTWGASAAEMCLALALCAAALREAVPGTSLPRRAIAASLLLTIAAILAITWITWTSSPTRVPSRIAAWVWQVCFGATIVSALPPLALAGWLAARAFALRPALTGALYGLGAGLMADAGWRLFCHFSHPAHVVGAHLLAVVVVCGLGAAVARVSAARCPRGWEAVSDGER